ncbi:hypothetical protein NGF19_19695 [Streptomyces sp. RY43-2]|uniref:Uncharacterized protein n=1 Tax=Streptomyces macrolidinus TaxID=2952607 RepID=A0ABT0ZHH7_9ACTN|nr:hypothetical protein [Streptomyces macrolidinus]MCN9242996.1 hypothetical protein [Streptomyces macrolidinus]
MPSTSYAGAAMTPRMPPEVMAEGIVRDLQSALDGFTAIACSLGGEVDVPEAEAE